MLPRLAALELAGEDFAERHVEEAVEAPDRIELLHIDIAAGHAGRVDVHIDHLADHQRVPVGAELDDLVQLAFEVIGTSLTRGGLIFTLGIAVRPVLSNSLLSSGRALAESTISFH